ncbi:CAP domain-containing protein [Kriegella aquimaris]|uniref:Cysteine-rich secretory protein family protein n=1 Tax=Kriegella aquimaris TaxID=192904 RepID=A0A1G9QVY0_9FLAO|nr:CAP domain-containing protein [Kriegella aquimaris]SDM15169.1 Cysteine-rich secretory protein family protein [Kriegella aquimaris]
MLRDLYSCTGFLIISLTLFTSCSSDDNLSTTPLEIETDNLARLAAKELYVDYYKASKTNGSETQWSGNTTTCDPGAVPTDVMNKIFLRLQYYRKAVGLENTVTENIDQSAKAQKAALMMKSNNKLDHFPPASWSCFTEEGSEAAGKSNLTMTKNAEAIDSYISEPGDSNGPVGHRRWLLYPRLRSIGVGNTNSSNAIWVVGNSGQEPSNMPEFIAWPPAGYVPGNVVFPRWSFSIPGADFSQAQVSMIDENGKVIELNLEELSLAYADPTIVWVPKGIKTNESIDTSYLVTIKSVALDGQILDYEYLVTLFNPED